MVKAWRANKAANRVGAATRLPVNFPRKLSRTIIDQRIASLENLRFRLVSSLQNRASARTECFQIKDHGSRPRGYLSDGLDRHYPEKAPVHRVTVDGFWIDRHLSPIASSATFVNATGYATFAEIRPTRRISDACRNAQCRLTCVHSAQGSRGPYCGEWWTFAFGANWRRPEAATAISADR